MRMKISTALPQTGEARSGEGALAGYFNYCLRQGLSGWALQEGDSVHEKCGKQKGTEMRNYPLTAKEQHKRKEKLAKIRQTVMIILMLVAGLYYMTVERSQVTSAAVVTSVEESAATMLEDARQKATEKETKFTIEEFVKSTLAPDEKKDVETKEAESKRSGEADMAPITAEEIVVDASRVPQAVPSVSANITDAPTIAAQTESFTETTALPVEDKRVNLNTATLEELDALPGVGPSTAKNIIDYREAHGGFAAPEEIMNVKRIGEKTFQKLKEFIKV